MTKRERLEERATSLGLRLKQIKGFRTQGYRVEIPDLQVTRRHEYAVVKDGKKARDFSLLPETPFYLAYHLDHVEEILDAVERKRKREGAKSL